MSSEKEQNNLKKSVFFIAKNLKSKYSSIKEENKNLKTKLVDGGKKTMDSISGFFNKKKVTTTASDNDDVFATIQKLSELKDSGVITQEEFAAKKAELLTKI